MTTWSMGCHFMIHDAGHVRQGGGGRPWPCGPRPCGGKGEATIAVSEEKRSGVTAHVLGMSGLGGPRGASSTSSGAAAQRAAGAPLRGPPGTSALLQLLHNVRVSLPQLVDAVVVSRPVRTDREDVLREAGGRDEGGGPGLPRLLPHWPASHKSAELGARPRRSLEARKCKSDPARNFPLASAETRPSEGKIRRKLDEVCRNPPNVGRNRQIYGGAWPELGRARWQKPAESGRRWPLVCQSRPNSARNQPNLVDDGPISAGVDPQFAEIGSCWPRIAPCRPDLAEISQSWSKIAEGWSKSAQCWSTPVKFSRPQPPKLVDHSPDHKLIVSRIVSIQAQIRMCPNCVSLLVEEGVVSLRKVRTPSRCLQNKPWGVLLRLATAANGAAALVYAGALLSGA